MYRTYNARPIPGQQKQTGRSATTRLWALLPVVPVLAIAYVAYALLRPVDAPVTSIMPPVTPAQVKVGIPWPAVGKAAFGADGYGLLDTNGDQTPMPTASVTKIITALTILQKKPLKAGEPGPQVPITAADVARYHEYIAKDGAAVPVIEGQPITQYQALQALLLPSANNIADTLAVWAYGSVEAYSAAATAYVRTLGMQQTTVTDASGFSPATVSTPGDLVILGDTALDHPVVAEIIGQKQAIFPNVGTIENVNSLIGQHGVRGIKTGNTEEAGGCYLAAADVLVQGRKVTVITAVMGSTSRPQAMRDSVPIIQSAVSQFRKVSVVEQGAKVGSVTTDWGGPTDLVADTDIQLLAWNGTALAPKASRQDVSVGAAKGARAGTLSLDINGKTVTSAVTTADAVAGPSALWRLTHPID